MYPDETCLATWPIVIKREGAKAEIFLLRCELHKSHATETKHVLPTDHLAQGLKWPVGQDQPWFNPAIRGLR